VLLIGDPGTAKTQLVKKTLEVASRGRYVSGKSASAVGLTAAVVKDELLGGFTIKAGVFAICNNGIVGLDELNHISAEDKSALHNVMESGEVMIAKGGLNQKLSAKATVIAAANPKHGTFDMNDDLPAQFDLPQPIMNRFDAIFVIKDKADEVTDRKIYKSMLNNDKEDAVYNKSFIKKYIRECGKLEPTLTDDANQCVEDFYIKLRNLKKENMMLINPRLPRAVLNIASAMAKLQRKQRVTVEHVKESIDLTLYWLASTGAYNPNTGEFDVAVIEVGVSQKKADIMLMISRIIREHNFSMPINELIEEIKKISGLYEEEIEKIIEKMKSVGELYAPNGNTIAMIR